MFGTARMVAPTRPIKYETVCTVCSRPN
jgi:hypothetical protein